MDLSKGGLDLTGGKQYPLDGSEIPFISIDDVRALLPGYAQEGDDSTMRLAVLTMIQAVANYIWARIGINLNALRSPRFAAGALLDVWGGIRQLSRASGESIGQYRTRLLSPTRGKTPNAIRSAIAALVATVDAPLAFQEPHSDGFFLCAETTPWDCFLQPTGNAIFWGYDPLAFNQTFGNYLVPDSPGAQFWVIMQRGAGDNGVSCRICDEAGTNAETQDFIGDDNNAHIGSEWNFIAADDDSLDERIIGQTNALRAFGVAWALIEEPNLRSAK